MDLTVRPSYEEAARDFFPNNFAVRCEAGASRRDRRALQSPRAPASVPRPTMLRAVAPFDA